MGQPFVAEIRVFSFNFPPKGWAFCNGQTLGIAQNQALFAIVGTTYGGNGQTNFLLPNLQGCTPVHPGQGIALGQRSGEENHMLLVGEMPAHNHVVIGASNASDAPSPVGNLLGAGSSTALLPYAASLGSAATLSPASITNAGAGQGHANMQPYLVLNMCIALVGIFPSRN